MYQLGDHFKHHGRKMGYPSKKAYDAGARKFFGKYKKTARIYIGKYNGSHGIYSDKYQYIIQKNGKSLIMSGDGQLVDFYRGTSFKAFINIERMQ